jgi:methyl-accepting chemotaxis protein
MSKISIRNKINLLLVISIVVALLGVWSYFNIELSKTEHRIEEVVEHELQENVQDAIQNKLDVGISNAISIANNEQIIQALKTDNRALAIGALKSISAKFKTDTPFKNIKVHIHTKDNHSFVRAWKLDKFGDDLSSFRHSVVKVNSTQKSVNGFEVGKAGLGIRSVVPITDQEGVHYGSLEFIQGINSVAKLFDREKEGFVLLMNKSLLPQGSFTKNSMIGDYVISQKFVNKAFLQDIQTIDLKTLINNHHLQSDKYLYTYKEVKDFNDHTVGIAVIARPLSIVTLALDETQSILMSSMSIFVLILIALVIAIYIVLSRVVITPLKDLEEGIEKLSQKSDISHRVSVTAEDEIGDIQKTFNRYLDNVEEGLLQDQKVIDEALEVVEKAKSGFYTYQVDAQAHNQQLEHLKQAMNEMMRATRDDLQMVTEALIQFGNANYNYTVQTDQMGNIASLIKGTNALGVSITEVLAMINTTSVRLATNSSDLAATSEELSASSTQQASSIEETAAAIEQITATIKTTSEQAQHMQSIAEEMKQTSDKDDGLAHKTDRAMDEINKATEDIVQAIEIIDQIAFQTNILSLNAAVEAATAGEAGKGFAVVAQEVRNLAGRSAEAAKTIKELVTYAQEKTAEGKSTANDMVKSFQFLNSKVADVLDAVGDVSTATKEQTNGMGQISESINQIDISTQENANAAETISQKAMILSEISEHLLALINRTEFNHDKAAGTCDVNLIFDTTKLKLDHILFKENAFKNLHTYETMTLKKDTECALGKWVEAHENHHFAQTSEWSEFKAYHRGVHENVQKYLDLNATDNNDPKLKEIANDIERNTDGVFNMIDRLKVLNCKDSDRESDRSRDHLKGIENPVEYAHDVHELKEKEAGKTWDSF